MSPMSAWISPSRGAAAAAVNAASSASSSLLVAASERARPNRARAESGRPRHARAILALGFIEEASRPQRIGVQRQRLGIVGRQLAQGFALPGAHE